jgi:outer membrane protein, adhesin transport system
MRGLKARLPLFVVCAAAVTVSACQSTRSGLVLGARSCAPPAACAPDPAAATAVTVGPRLTLPPMLREAQATPTAQGLKPADPATTGSVSAHGAAGASKATQNGRQFVRLQDAVASAVMEFPEIAASKARVREAAAGIGIAHSALLPSADLRIAAGGNYSGSFEGRAIPYQTASNAPDGRLDGGLVLRQLIYDFGATRADVERAKLQRDAEHMKLMEKIDEIAHRTSQAYLRILEQRALQGLVDETIGAHERLLKLIQAHAKEGHGTVADVQRVNARLIDVRAIRSDVSLQLLAAEDQFERLTRGRAGKLGAVPDLALAIPVGPGEAIHRMLANNPRLAALHATRQSTHKELEQQRASRLPKINLELDTESKNFRNGQLARTQLEGRALIAMRYRLLDGGLSRATDEQISARIQGHDMTFLNEREQFEADIRQAYRAIDSAKRKSRLVSEGVASAKRVQDLYLEQFKGGKRTIFELLDGQMSFYTARRSQIESQFEGRRAVFDILRSVGELTARLSRN